MAKQKCGTCRFFQDAGLAGSGWCHHPQRKVSSGVMIMVRQNELACRDEWSRSLWSPAQGANEAEKSFQRPPILGPVQPANAEQMRKMLLDDAIAAAAPQGEDVLLSEARIVSEIVETPALKERPPQTGGFDPRTAVFRAREAYRERSRARESAARHSAGAEAIGTRHEWDASGEVPDDSAFEMRDVEDGLTLTSPAFAGDASPARSQPAHGRPERESFPMLREEPPLNDASGAGVDAGVWVHAEAAQDENSGRRPVETVEWAVELQSEPPQYAHEPDLSLTKLAEIDETRLPEWFRTDLPRICRTCRDYRPSADGGRGWCANAWAFTHRRLVQEDDAAPCDSSIGDWWVPVDDVWLVAADVSSHGRVTPLLDRVPAQPAERRRRS